MAFRNVVLHLYVRDALASGSWYERVLNVRTSDIKEYGNDSRYLDIKFGSFRIVLDERGHSREQNMAVGNLGMCIEIEVTRDFMDRLDMLGLPKEDDWIADDYGARWVYLRDPDDNAIHLACYDDFRPSGPRRVLRAER